MSTTDPHPLDRPDTLIDGEPADRGDPTTRGVVLQVRDATLVVTVMPADAPPYRARVALAPDELHRGIRAGTYVELVIGADPSEIRLADDSPPTE